METPERISELERLSEVADAALGVAEELGYTVALLAGLAAHLRWGSWLITVPAAVVAYVLSTYRYRRRADKAEDAYFRAAKLGKYSEERQRSDGSRVT